MQVGAGVKELCDKGDALLLEETGKVTQICFVVDDHGRLKSEGNDEMINFL